ncbi:hypothetical protein ZWY2020_042020 [Hordeum vulgare]|nr:hypothetical protein ZWY2020_042020 [Hordeum vulgare]
MGKLLFLLILLLLLSLYAELLIRLNEFLAKIGVHCAPHKYYWQHKLGQYSLLDYKPTLRYKLIGCNDAAPGDQVALGILDPVNNCKRRNCAKAIEVPAQVKKALIYSLKRTNGELVNGKSSLASNGAGHLVWACTRKVQSASDTSGIILTWHIATWYCEKGTSKHGPSLDEGTQLKIHHGVATKLSKYCAYLVVHAQSFFLAPL